MKCKVLFVTPLVLLLSTTNRIYGQEPSDQGVTARPAAAPASDVSRGPGRTLPFRAQLLLIKSDWSQGNNAEEIEAGWREALKDVPLSQELLEKLPASGPEILFAPDLVKFYKIEHFQQLYRWLTQHELVEEWALVPDPEPLLPSSVREKARANKVGIPVDEYTANVSKRMDFIPLPPPLRRPGAASGYGRIYWDIVLSKESGRLAIVRKPVVMERKTEQGTASLAYDCLCSVTRYVLPKGHAALTHAFPASEESEYRDAARRAGVEPLVVVFDLSPREYSRGSGKKHPPRESRFCLPDSVETVSVQHGHEANLLGPRMFPGRVPPGITRDPASPSSANPPQPTASAQEVRVFRLKAADADSLAETLTQLFREDIAIAVDDRDNTLMVRGTGFHISEAADLIEQIDVSDAADSNEDHAEATNGGVDEALAAFDRNLQALGTLDSLLPTSPAMIEELRWIYESNELLAGETAAELRRLRNSKTDAARRSALGRKLRQQVAESFTLRQQLHEAELANLLWELKRANKAIDRRDRIRDQIIDRRVQDLLSPEQRWEGGPETEHVGERYRDELAKSQHSPGALDTGVERGDAQSEQSAGELEGDWRLESVVGKGVVRHLQPVKARIRGNVWTDVRQGHESHRHMVLDTTAEPKTIDLIDERERMRPPVIPPAPAHYRGIYDLRGDTLTIAWGLEDDNVRPAGFEWEKCTIFTWKRIKGAELVPATVENSAAANEEAIPVASKSTEEDAAATVGSSASIQHPRAITVRNLARLMLAMHEYCDVHKHFPPATVLGKDGKGTVPHSWRVELLPFLGQQELYDQYRFDEPWDSDHNKTQLAKMPDVFRSPLDASDSTNTSYFGVVAKDLKPKPADEVQASKPDPIVRGGVHDGLFVPRGMCFLWPSHGSRLGCFIDGTRHTIALVEAKRDVPWTKPEDIVYDAQQPLPRFGGWFREGFFAAFADGTVRLVLANNYERTIRNLLTISDLERFEPRAIDSTLRDDPLEFRILPNHVDAGREPFLSEGEFERYRHQLAKGDLARPLHGDGYCWREIDPSIPDIPFAMEEDDRSYVLASYLDNTLLWGELKGHFRVLGSEMRLPGGASSLDIEFDDEVGDKLRRLARANLKNRLAIVVCGKVIMAPTIRSEVGSKVRITGAFSKDELTAVLKALQGAAETDGETGDQGAASSGQTAPSPTDQLPAAKPVLAKTPLLTVKGPNSGRVGQKVQFKLELHNAGREVQAAQMSITHDDSLFPVNATAGFTIAKNRRNLNWRIESLPSGGSITRTVEFECTNPRRDAEVRFTVVLSDKSELTTKARITIHENDGPVRLKPEPEKTDVSDKDNGDQPLEKSASTDLAFDGFCPVTLVEEEKFLLGRAAYSLLYNGARYNFASQKALDTFKAKPTRFAPVMDGRDVVIAKDESRLVSGVPQHGIWFGERIFLFESAESLEKFWKNPEYYYESVFQKGALPPIPSSDAVERSRD